MAEECLPPSITPFIPNESAVSWQNAISVIKQGFLYNDNRIMVTTGVYLPSAL